MARLLGKRVDFSAAGGGNTAGAGGGVVDLVRFDSLDADKALTLSFQILNPVNVGIGLLGFNASLLVEINGVSGAGVSLARAFFVTGQAWRSVRVAGARSLVVTARLVLPNLGNPYDNFSPPASPATCSLNLVCNEENVDFLGEDLGVWNPSFTRSSQFAAGNPAGGPGKLLALNGGLLNMGGATELFLWLMDSLDAKISTTITVTNPGSGYTTPPSVVFTLPSGSRGPAIRKPSAHAVLSGNTVGSVVVDDPGEGLMQTPIISFTGGGGANAAATATLSLIPSQTMFPVLGPFFQPAPFAFNDELKPGLYFQGGLSWGLSSTAPTGSGAAGYTEADNAQAWADAKVAQ